LKGDYENMKSNKDIWKSNIGEEVEYWKIWMTREEFKDSLAARLRDDILPQTMIDLLNLPKGSMVKVLDVGSGPISTLGTHHPDFDVTLYPVDPLAEEYNHFLDELRLSQCPRIIPGAGEDLRNLFPENNFDIVFSANALDHAYDPLSCIKNMVYVCKPSGWILIVTIQNEGQRQHYHGLHQWNFELIDKHVRLWNQNNDLSIHEQLDDIDSFECFPVDHGNGLPVIMIQMKKKV
jgi:SAM-dependent methyltransferase